MTEKTVVIDDSTSWDSVRNPTIDGQRMDCKSFGMFSPGFADDQVPEGCAGTFDDLESVPLIPESEWPDRIRQMEIDKTRLIDHAHDAKMAIRNQKRSSSCWGFGVARGIEYRLLTQGNQQYISPFSITAPVNGWRDRGGWGDSALKFAATSGYNLADEWPCESGWQRNFRDYYTAENKAVAKKRVVLEWYKLKSGRAGWGQVVSCILAGHSVPAGFNHWGHLVDLTWLTQDLGAGFDNSWGPGYGGEGIMAGRGILKGRKKYPDGAVVITSVRPF